jgi:hypothetical protein
MHDLSVRLSGKRLYIAHLATRLEAMERGRTPMNAIAYRLYARRMKTAMADYPQALLAAQLGPVCPSVLQAIEQRRFEADGVMPGDHGRRALRTASALFRQLTGKRR